MKRKVASKAQGPGPPLRSFELGARVQTRGPSVSRNIIYFSSPGAGEKLLELIFCFNQEGASACQFEALLPMPLQHAKLCSHPHTHAPKSPSQASLRGGRRTSGRNQVLLGRFGRLRVRELADLGRRRVHSLDLTRKWKATCFSMKSFMVKWMAMVKSVKWHGPNFG